jgi:hypothetical protein
LEQIKKAMELLIV